MTNNASEEVIVRTYGNFRKPASAGLLGLGAAGTALLLAGFIGVIITMMRAGFFAGVGVAAFVVLALVVVAIRDSHGQNFLSRTAQKAAWMKTRINGENVYRSGPIGAQPTGTFKLPGIGAATELSEHRDSYDRPFALLRTPTAQGPSYSIVIGTEPTGAALVDQDDVDRWIAQYGHWLALLADEAGIEGASVTIETAPDSGQRLRRTVEQNMDAQAPVFAQNMLNEAVEIYPSGSSQIRAYISLTFSASVRRGSKRRKADEMARDIASRIPALTAGLTAAGAGAARPLSAVEVCEIVRVAYDPVSAVIIDEAHAMGVNTEISWEDAGPAAAEASWSSYRHDSGHSITWAMSGAPRGNVQGNILNRLLAPHREIARKRVTLLYRPIPPARAAAMVDQDLNNASFRATSKAKANARDLAAVRAAQSAAQEEAAGAGLVNFGMLVTATTLTSENLPDVIAAVDNLGASARIRLRPVYGSQDSAFAAALPLGLILTKHIKIPAELRNNL